MRTVNRREKPVSTLSDGVKSCITAAEASIDQANEAVLLERCIAGDMTAWDGLIRKYETVVFRFAYGLCKDRDDAADIAGHVFVRVYQNLHTFRHEASFSSWLFRIVRNTHLDICVRPAWRTNVSLDAESSSDAHTSKSQISEMADPCPTPEAVCLKKEVARLLASAVRHLPAYQREVVRMYHADGKSYEEIAQETGLSIGTVKSRLNRARNMLRERLMPYKETLTTA